MRKTWFLILFSNRKRLQEIHSSKMLRLVWILLAVTIQVKSLSNRDARFLDLATRPRQGRQQGKGIFFNEFLCYFDQIIFKLHLWIKIYIYIHLFLLYIAAGLSNQSSYWKGVTKAWHWQIYLHIIRFFKNFVSWKPCEMPFSEGK